jgi:hypothetical protein
MFANAKKILIETESTETLTVRFIGSHRSVNGFCDRCDRDSEMHDLNSAVSISGRGARDLIGEIAGGQLHTVQTPSGHLLICGNSLHAHRADTGRDAIPPQPG